MEARRSGTLRRIAIGAGTALAVLGVAIIVLLDPLYTHAALDAAGSASILGLDTATTHAMSDRTIAEMVFGPATFEFTATSGGPRFYDAAEASHLRDARNVLYLFLGVVALGVVALLVGLLPRRRDPRAWRAVQAGSVVLAAAFAALGLFFALAFEPAFTLFHEVFFPQGNWEFDTATERMVQLYPTPFWELTAMMLAVLVLALCAAAWLVGRNRVRALERAAAVPPAPAAPPAAESTSTGAAR